MPLCPMPAQGRWPTLARPEVAGKLLPEKSTGTHAPDNIQANVTRWDL